MLVNKGNEPLPVKVDGPGVLDLWLMYNTAENRNLEYVTSYKGNLFLLPAKSITTLVGLSILNDYDPLFTKTKTNAAGESTQGGLQLYPNPSNGIINIEGISLDKVEIIDVSGNLVYQTSLRPGRNSVSVSNLSPGVYITKIYSKEGISSRKIIIARQKKRGRK